MARSSRPLLTMLAVLSTVALPLAARAQTLELALAGSAGGTPGLGGRATVGIADARVGATRVDLALAYDGAAQLDFGMRANDTFGPLGNVIGEASLSLRTDANAEGAAGVRGVLGPVALGVRLAAFSADPQRFDPWALAGDTRPRFGSSGWSVAVDASGRPARPLVLEVHPQLYLVPAGTAWRADARLRWLRAIGPHELSLRLNGYLGPASAADGALGIGFTYHRRGAPDLDGALYLGAGPSGIRPGLTLALGQAFGPVDVTFAASAEPYRRDLAPYRARLALSMPVGAGTGTVRAAAADEGGSARAIVGVSYQLPVELPAP